MKVKIKGLVFVGFAAAILSANAFAAADDNIVTSKSYVDSKYTATDGLAIDNGTGVNAGKKVITNTGVRGVVASDQNDAEGTIRLNVGGTPTAYPVKNVEVTGNKVTSMDSESTNDQYPSAKAVYDAIAAVGSGAANAYQPKTVAKIQVATLDSQNKPTWAGMGDAVNTGTYTTKSVDAQTGVITIEANGTTDTSLSSSTEVNKLPTAATVKTYVDSEIDTLESAVNTALAGKQSKSNADTGTYKVGHTGDTWATLGGQDYVYIDTTDTTAPKIDLADSRITSSSVLQSDSTKLTREQDVYGAIQAATGGTTIPAQNPSVCTASTPCALVAEYNSTNTAMELHWRTMATATDSGGVLGDAQ